MKNVYIHRYWIRKFKIWRREYIYNRYVLGSRYGELSEKRLNYVYTIVNRFLAELEIDYWLIFGTLLGYFREKKLILQDGDIDFGAPESSYRVILENAHRLPKGFKLYDASHINKGPKVYIMWRGWYADIDFYSKVEDKWVTNWDTDTLSYSHPIPNDLIFPIKKAVFLNETTSIPHQTERTLKHIYNYIGRNGFRDKETGYWYEKEGE